MKISQNGWSFFNFPKQLAKKDYEIAANFIEAKLKTLPLEALYKTGSITAPGFSDIDYVAVVNQFLPEIKEATCYESYDEPTRYILFHDILTLTKPIAKKFGAILGTRHENWQLVQGKKITFSKTSKPMIDFRFLDDLVMHTARYLYTSFLTKKIDVRETLNKLYAMFYGYSLPYLTFIGKKKELQRKKLRAEVNTLRKKWFILSHEKRLQMLTDLLKTAVSINQEDILLFREYLIHNYCNASSSLKHSFILDTLYPIAFLSHNNYFGLTKKIWEKHKIIVPCFPVEFSCLLKIYSAEEGKLSKHIKKNSILLEKTLKEKYVKAAKKRIKFFNEHFDFAIKNNLEYGPLVSFEAHIKHSGKRWVKKKIRKQLTKKKLLHIKKKFSSFCS